MIAVVVTLCTLLIGCAGSSKSVMVDYDTIRDRTTYRMNMPVRIESQNSGYGSQFERLRMSLQARCEGRTCQPDATDLTLSTSGGSELYIGERTFIITADGERFTWEDTQYERRNRAERIVGMILRVSVGVDTLQQIANGKEVEGKVGSITLEISEDTQERIQSFLTEIGHESSTPDPA